MLSNNTLRTLAICLLMVTGFAASAQIDLPAPSPLGTVSQRVGFADITIAYSRPSAKGRVIFGDVVPFDQLWRTGANAATKVTISKDVTIEGKPVKAGEYSLFTIPTKGNWTIILNADTKATTTSYKQESDVLRFSVASSTLPASVETFTINFTNLTTNGATIELAWEKTAVRFKVENEVDAVVMEQIKKQTAGVNSNIYFASARYYYDTNRDLAQALKWIDLSFAGQDPAFYMLRQKALIQAGLKDYKGAIATAELSTVKAKEAKNDEYVKMNDASIAEWKKMK
ncbi:DUF2911 domain-containing protein [soil metagenome]